MKASIFAYTCGLLLVALSLQAESLKVGDAIDSLGVTVARSEGFMNLRIENTYFKLYFLDAEQKVIEPPVQRATIRYKEIKNRTQRAIYTLARSPNDPSLLSTRPAKPPYHYLLNIILRPPSPDKQEAPDDTSEASNLNVSPAINFLQN